MSVTIVQGGIGSGKTSYCINEIKRRHGAHPKDKCLMIVPSHYTHETEKIIVGEFGGTGINNIEVTSFEKLSRSVVNMTQRRLSAPGKQVLTARAAEITLSEMEERGDYFDAGLIAAVGKSGFIDVAASLISEMHRYAVSVEMLNTAAESTEDGTLRQKLEIIAILRATYDNLLERTDYADSDDDLLRLAAALEGVRFENTAIWLDNFDEFLPQQRAVVKALIDGGADITVTFPVCGEDTYYGTSAAIRGILDYCDAKTVILPGLMEHIKGRDDLRFLFTTWFDRSRYDGAVPNAELFEARDAYTETEHIASRILDFVREGKYRCRDISVICGSDEGYRHIIKAIFDEYDIPYYSDETLSIADHPIAMQTLSLFDIIENNWNYASMFEYLRAGFIYTARTTADGGVKYVKISPDDLDVLENYVLKYGIRGKSMWCRSWTEGQRLPLDTAFDAAAEIDPKAEKPESLRQVITEPILAFCEAAGKAETVTDYCRALFRFLEDINLYAGLKSELLGMAINRATADAQRFGQIWNLVLDVIDQTNTALGDMRVSTGEFFGYIRAAMTKCEIRTIPSGVDRVFIGTVEKNRAVNSKIIFMAGAVSGTFPTDNDKEGFLSNADREYLNDRNMRLAPTTTMKNAKLYNSVYKTLSSVTDRLCISYPVQTAEGKASRASQTALDICAKLPAIRKYNDIYDNDAMYVSSPKATLHKLLITPKSNPVWEYVYSWFREHDEWRAGMFTIRNAKNRYGDSAKIELDKTLASQLYSGVMTYSATKLNAYADCPFGFFVKYGLRAREREEWELNAADTGTYAHEIIRELCDAVSENPDLDWGTITDEECGRIVGEIVEKTASRVESSDIRSRERTANIFRRMGNTVKAAAKNIRRSVASGDFRILDCEREVNAPLTDSIRVTGIIDRLDVCVHDGVNEYRIIDYKTGKKEFKVSEILQGYDMQPVIYAMVMRMLDKRGMISGMYYSRVRNDFAKLASNATAVKLRSELDKNIQMSGATFVDTDADGGIREDCANRIEHETERAEGSLFFNKKMKTGKNVRNRAAGENLIAAVYDKIIMTDREIRSGKIDISPLDRGTVSGACAYCPSAPICRFDRDNAVSRTIPQKDDDVWKELESDKKRE